MPPPPPPPSRPRSPPPCPPPPPPSPVHRTPSSSAEPLSTSASTDVDAQLPTLPKRDYTPVLPAVLVASSPSHLLGMLRTLARVLSWAGAAGGVLGFVYYKYVLPRLDETLARRAALKAHALALATRLASQLQQLHIAQQGKHLLPASSSSSSSPEEAAAATAQAGNAADLKALVDELQKLKESHEPRASSQKALQTLSSLSSYVSARTYGPLPGRRLPGTAGTSTSTSATTVRGAGQAEGPRTTEEKWEAALLAWEREAEGVVRESRAVKGLLLNRRSFAVPV